MTKKDKGGAAAAPKAVIKANQSAMKGYPSAKIKAAFNIMAAAKTEADASTDAKAMAAVSICRLARGFRVSNKDRKLETVVESWKDNFKVTVLQMAVDGMTFAELKQGEGDNPATAKLTGYGNNVASIAKGVLDFELDLIGEDGKIQSYRDIRTSVEAHRHEARRDTNPDAAALADARQSADDAWKELRKVVFDTADTKGIDSLAAALKELTASVQEQLIAQSDLDDEVKALEAVVEGDAEQVAKAA